MGYALCVVITNLGLFCYNNRLQGMRSFRLLIPLRLLETPAHACINLYSSDLPWIQDCMLIYLTRNFILLKIHDS